MSFQKTWIICCFFNFLIACLFGLLMRFMYVFPIDVLNYSYLLHAHSHTAMLGWVYLMIYVLIVHFFIPKEKSQKPIYNRLFWLTEFSVIGMMIAFPIQGYALFSIVFSTMHILLSYVLCSLVWKDSLRDKSPAHRLLLASLLFMILSTFGVWCLGPAVSILGKQSVFYQSAIQFFLHFQFNGWFILAVLALFLKQFQEKIAPIKFKKCYLLLVVSTLLTVCFPIRLFVERDFLSYINTFGVLMQFAGFMYFYKMLQDQISSFKKQLNSTTQLVYGLAVCSLFLKIGIQLLTIFPNIGVVTHQIRNWVIGFIHLTTLGIITGFILGILLQNKMLCARCSAVKNGVKCFVLGYILTEILLFLQGIYLYSTGQTIIMYYQNILLCSIMMVLGLVFILISLLKSSFNKFDI